MINIIVAVSKNGVIGVEPNELPWVLPGDLKKFKELTEGETLVVGRKTFDSLGNKPLANREMQVLTTARKPLPIKGVKFFNNVHSLVKDLEFDQDIWVCGGTQVYNMFMPLADAVYITLVDVEIPNGKAKFDYSAVANSGKFELIYKSNTQTEFDLVSESDLEYRFEEWARK